MRRELALYVSGLALITALAFSIAFEFFFIKGLDEAVGGALLMEARSFEAKYRQNLETPLSNSSSIRSFLDNLDNAPEFYRQLIDPDTLQPGQFSDYHWGEEDWQDSRYLIVYLHLLPDQRRLFVISDYQSNLLTKEEQADLDQTWQLKFYLAGGYLLIMLVAIWIYNRRINHYTQKLADWAESLSLENIQQPVPDFRFHELNSIAERLRNAFDRIAGLMEREHQFVRHASHELRTPIAIIRANMELLQRVGIPTTFERPMERINRASQNMQQLTGTLLWLSRENDTPPSISSVDPARLLDDISEELAYLLQGKEVQLQRDYPEARSVQPLPLVPLRIVLANLLRNAYQFTERGTITLTVTNQRIVIRNNSEYLAEDSDSSFGLGLMLVQKICDRLGWQLSLEWLNHGVRAELMFPVPPPPESKA